MALGSVLGAAIGGGLQYLGAREANRGAAASVAQQLAFQKESAQNRYQWTMDDMQKAGLNPILAYQQGGGTALQGAAYQPVNTLGHAGDSINSAFQNMKLGAETDSIREQAKKITQETQNLTTQNFHEWLKTNLTSAQTENEREKIKVAGTIATLNRTRDMLTSGQIGLNKLEQQQFEQQIDRLDRLLPTFDASAAQAEIEEFVKTNKWTKPLAYLGQILRELWFPGGPTSHVPNVNMNTTRIEK